MSHSEIEVDFISPVILDFGVSPKYHEQQMRLLAQQWPALAGALVNHLKQRGYSVPVQLIPPRVRS